MLLESDFGFAKIATLITLLPVTLLLMILQTAYKALTLHKVRSALTVLGLTIGIMAIILVMNMGQGFENYLMGQMDVFGKDYLDIEPRVPKDSMASQASSNSITTLTIEDAEKVAEHPNIRDYYVGALGQKIVSYAGTNKNSMLYAISSAGFDLYGPKVEAGRPFTDEEDRSLARVAVLGTKIKEDLFGNDDPINKRIKIGNQNFRVIGIMEEQGSMMGFFNMDEMIYVPIRTLQKVLMGTNHIQFIMAFMKDPSLSQQTAEDATLIVREQHEIDDPNKDDFEVMTTEEMMEVMDQITGGVNLLLFAVAAISLLVGGVGIMNIMYVSVSERTYEIGLRKAIGATKSKILWQFIWEAIFLTFLGGLVGVILGTLFTLVAMAAAKSFGFDFGNIIAPQGIIIAVSFSVLVGLIFGVYPARKAANMEPVEALRSE